MFFSGLHRARRESADLKNHSGAQQPFNDDGLIQSRFTEYQTKGNGQSENSFIAEGRHCDRPFRYPTNTPILTPNFNNQCMDKDKI